MVKKLHTYPSDDLVVEYDAARCTHVKECVKGLPTVFDPNRRPWVDPNLASPEAVEEVVRRCPTGALHYQRKTGESEAPPPTNEVRMAADGPLYVQGRLDIRIAGGATSHETRVALCRCGASTNKPYCDNSHTEAGFRDPATDVPQQLAEGDAAQSPLAVRFVPDGPILVDGSVTVRGSDASKTVGVKGALCRCGASSSKPFCDGSHAAAGFEAD
jgi:CDGSH-type Zn-finger protein/uncharacterized Fe-S cluster protein YjdI